MMLSINLISELCAHKGAIPNLIPRIILNNIVCMVKWEEIEMTEEHCQLAMNNLEKVKVEILFDYVSKFKLDLELEFYEKICHQHVE